MTAILAAALATTLFVCVKIWLYERREYLEKVDEEVLSLWRDRLRINRVERPDEEYDDPVAEEAVQMLLKSTGRRGKGFWIRRSRM